MGVALADEARLRGAHVTLVAGPMTVAAPAVDELVRVRSAREMHAAVMAHAPRAHVVIMAAAVADYTPTGGAVAAKIEKGGPLTLQLERTPDILAELGQWRGDAAAPLLIGFAAQAGDPVVAARRKLAAKRVDLVVANDITAPGSGFDVETNEVTLVGRDAPEERLPLLSKQDVARRVLDRIERLLADTSHPTLVR